MKPYNARQPDPHRVALNWASAALALLVAVILVVAAGPVWLWALSALVGAIFPALACLALLLFPGLALLRLCWDSPLALDERLPLALSLSCAVPPLLLLASDQVGLRWGGPLAWAALGACALIAFWPRRGPLQPAPESPYAVLTLALITVASLAVRLYATRDLVMGQFGDSVHHTIIAQLLVDNGGLFRSWQPYAQLTTLTYHYGFHSVVAWFSWLSGVPTRLALLAVGQMQSALAAPLLYLLTLRLSGSRSAALWAALIAGLITAMPGYYASWGRYTQVGGQMVLISVCVAWAALLDMATEPRPVWPALVRLGVLTGISTAGLALTHYRVAVFAVCFVLAYTIYLLAARVRSGRSFMWLAGAGLASGGLAILLALPWLLRLREGQLMQIGGHFISQNIGTEGANSIPEVIVRMVAPWPLVALSAAAIGLLIWRRQWSGLALPLCAALVGVAANPYLVGLGGAGAITNFAVMIASYLLLAPLAGVTLGELGTWAGRLPWGRYLAPATGVALAAWGLSWQPTNIERANELFRPADLAAMDWISAKTAPGDRVFVNSFTAYEGTLYAGSDGGWMLTFFSGRATNLPPITYGSEAGPDPDYLLRVNAENAAVLAHPVDSREAAAALRAAGFRYLYDGPAASPGNEYLDPTRIDASPLYAQVYHRDGVTIWRVR
ncbi:MAG: hypothetical protein WCJ55_06435 [Chloroflexales bacterium]